MTSAWIFETGFEWRLFKGNCVLGVDQCLRFGQFVCRHRLHPWEPRCGELLVETLLDNTFKGSSKPQWLIRNATLMSHWGLGNTLKVSFCLPWLKFTIWSVAAWKIQWMLSWAKENQARASICSFHKHILRAHHGVECTKKFQSRSLTLQGSQSRWEIGMQISDWDTGDKFCKGCALS